MNFFGKFSDIFTKKKKKNLSNVWDLIKENVGGRLSVLIYGIIMN